jgi:hypothetical protein
LLLEPAISAVIAVMTTDVDGEALPPVHTRGPYAMIFEKKKLIFLC